MNLRAIATVIAFSAICVACGHHSFAQTGGAADAKPTVTLIVNLTNLTVNRQGGSIAFVVDAAASDGFTGTISGTMGVSQPSNPSGVQLMEGNDGRSVRFTLKAGEKTSDTKPPQTLTFVVRTSPKNPTSGILTYIVGVAPSDQFTTKDPIEVKVITSP